MGRNVERLLERFHHAVGSSLWRLRFGEEHHRATAFAYPQSHVPGGQPGVDGGSASETESASRCRKWIWLLCIAEQPCVSIAAGRDGFGHSYSVRSDGDGRSVPFQL